MKKVLLALIRFYQGTLSPYIGRNCKYIPTCSNYAYEAISKYGALKGTRLAIWRILRCNPWSKGGFDYVPDKLFKRK